MDREVYNSNGDLISGTGWGQRIRPAKPTRLDADCADGTNSIVNRATQELWVRSKMDMIGLDWNDLRAFLIKNCPQYDASQVLYSMRIQGKLLRVYIDSDGLKEIQWRDDLVREREVWCERLFEEEASEFLTRSDIRGNEEEIFGHAQTELSERAYQIFSQIFKAKKSMLNEPNEEEADEADDDEEMGRR